MTTNFFQRVALFLLLAVFPVLVAAQKFEFALIGDMPYRDVDVRKFEHLVEEINQERRIRWVMHTGDIKSGSSPCTNEYFRVRLDLYQTIRKPFIITPGDNEWTDCHRPKCGSFDPLERLAALRRIFYANPHQSLGQKTMPLETQQDNPGFGAYPENQRWEHKGVWFATCHIVGSRNGTASFDGRTPANDREAEDRTQAAIQWLRETFRLAREDKAVFLMIHANPKLESASDAKKARGFYEFLAALEEEVIRFGKPVVLAHGDSHYFRYDKPLVNRKTGNRIENFTRLEAFGANDVHWIRVRVNGKDPNVFQIRQELMEKNFEQH